jgi:hypothetical protein
MKTAQRYLSIVKLDFAFDFQKPCPGEPGSGICFSPDFSGFPVHRLADSLNLD